MSTQRPANCKITNGSYCCILPDGHDGPHVAEYRVEGEVRRSTYRDGFSPLKVHDTGTAAEVDR